jgi:hypothetical protein
MEERGFHEERRSLQIRGGHVGDDGGFDGFDGLVSDKGDKRRKTRGARGSLDERRPRKATMKKDSTGKDREIERIERSRELKGSRGVETSKGRKDRGLSRRELPQLSAKRRKEHTLRKHSMAMVQGSFHPEGAKRGQVGNRLEVTASSQTTWRMERKVIEDDPEADKDRFDGI